jgi:small subunit ribosomal protein S21
LAFYKKRDYKKNYFKKEPFIPGISVVVQNNNTDAALRKFKKKVQEEGILQTVRDKQEYIKPSERRRKAKAAAKARWMKRLYKAVEQKK